MSDLDVYGILVDRYEIHVELGIGLLRAGEGRLRVGLVDA